MLAPSPQDYASQGHLYHGVLQGLARLAEQLGEERVFVGHGQAQVSSEEFGLPGLFRITDLASAQRAVEEIVLQGEGAPAHRDDSHFARFSAIRAELARLRAARPAFEPARPVARNPILGYTGIARSGVRVLAPVTARVVDLGNSIYALMVRTLAQVFAPAPLPRDLRAALAASTTVLMSTMGRVADVATRLPVDTGPPGLTAGLNFELPGSSGPLVQQCAARILGERSAELAAAARRLAHDVPLFEVANDLDALARRFEELHLRFESSLGEAVDRVAGLERAACASGCRGADGRTARRSGGSVRAGSRPHRSHHAAFRWPPLHTFAPLRAGCADRLSRQHAGCLDPSGEPRRWSTACVSRTIARPERSRTSATTADHRKQHPASTC